MLRRSAKRAGLWIPANMLAGAVGMPVIFAGIDLANKQAAAWQSLLVVVALLLMGTAVGAIEARFLIMMVGEPG